MINLVSTLVLEECGARDSVDFHRIRARFAKPAGLSLSPSSPLPTGEGLGVRPLPLITYKDTK